MADGSIKFKKGIGTSCAAVVLVLPEGELLCDFSVKIITLFNDFTDDISTTRVLSLGNSLRSLVLVHSERAHNLRLASLERRHHVFF